MGSRKFFIGLSFMLLVVMLGLVGCSSDGADKKGSGSGSGEKITIDIFQGKVEFKDQFEDLAKKYEAENENVEIKVTSVGGGTDYASSLKAVFTSGDEPVIFSIGGPKEIEEFEDYLADLSDTKSAGLALEGSLDLVTKGEETLGLPFNQEGYGLIYNKEVFAAAGINADEILTYEDLVAAVETLDKQKEALGIEAVFALPGKERWVMADHLANAFLAPEFNHDGLESYAAETVEFEKADEMKRFLDLQNKYSVQPVLSLDYSQQVEEYFSLEQVAIIQQGNWIYNSIYDMDPDFAENGIGIMPIPVEGHEGSMPVGVPNFWAVNKNFDDEVVAAAKDFLDWMNTSEAGKEIVLEDLKFIPAYEEYDTSKIADPLSQKIYEYASEGNTIGWVFLGYPGDWTDDGLGANMQEYLSGGLSWDEVISKSRTKWEESRK